MPSPPALQFGCYYHIYTRGNNGETIFREARNYEYFMRLYARHIPPVADTYAYCLLKNHFHLLVRIKTEAEIRNEVMQTIQETFRVSKTLKVSLEVSARAPSQAFSNLLNAYTKAVNKAYRRSGSLFEHPFGRVEVTNQAYFARLVIYIHQNPQRHGLIADFRDWPYSSYNALCSTKPTQLQREQTLAWFGDRNHFVRAHAKLQTLDPDQDPEGLED